MSQLVLLVFIFSGKMPFGWLVKSIGSVLLISGFALTSVATLVLRECISPFVVPVNTLGFKSQGPYRLARHPVYGGTLLMCTGWSLMSNSLDRALLTAVLSVVLNQKASLEESFLQRMFEGSYSDYAYGRCKLIPFIY